MSYSSKDRHRVPGYYENHQPVQRESRNQHGEVRYAWQESSSPRGNTGDANSSFDRSQQRSGHRSAATDEGDMDTEETLDKSNKDVSLQTTEELFTTLENLPKLVDQAKREIKMIYQSAPTKVERENAELKKRLEQLSKDYQRLESMSSTNQVDQVDQVNKLKDDLQKARDEAKENKTGCSEINGKYKQTREEARTLRETAQKGGEKIEALEESLRQHKRDMNELATECESLRRELSLSKENQTKTEVDKKKAESELSQSRTRLSRLMGNKLSNNNPDIADLSDKNRPTKIAEKYTELYDNEWTDAFEVIQERYNNEQRTIETLLKMLWDAKEQCDQFTMYQDQKLREAVVLKHTRDISLPEHILKQIKDFKRFIVESSLPEVIEKCLQNTRYKSILLRMKDEHVETFYKSCVELCWLMSVQDPPLAFGEVPKQMERFDTDTYKPYTATGLNVDYVVWPKLLLKESGPLLSKGVAQACGQQPNKSFRQRNIESPISDAGSSRRGQSAPMGQDIDRNASESGSFADSKSQDSSNASRTFYSTGQSAPGQNYAQLVVNNRNRIDMSNTISHASNNGRHTTVAAQLNKDLSRSHREPLDRKIPRVPSYKLYNTFKSMVNVYGIDHPNVQQAFGENYKVCLDYYNYLLRKHQDTTV